MHRPDSDGSGAPGHSSGSVIDLPLIYVVLQVRRQQPRLKVAFVTTLTSSCRAAVLYIAVLPTVPPSLPGEVPAISAVDTTVIDDSTYELH